MELVLKRKYFPNGTNGTITHKNNVICHTIELPWRENLPMVSCIPEGQYQLTPRTSPRFQQHVLLRSVPFRSLILIHPANVAHIELKGCIAPVTRITGEGKGASSRSAFTELMQLIYSHLKKEDVWLHIKSNTPVISMAAYNNNKPVLLRVA
jgi:hypothetical protein